MHINHADDSVPFQSPHGEIVQELAGQSAGGTRQHSVAQITLPAGKKSLKHYHPVAEESYYILQGQGRVEIEGETQLVRAGQFIAIPAPQVHQIFNDSEEALIFLAICTPSWTPECSVFLEDDLSD